MRVALEEQRILAGIVPGGANSATQQQQVTLFGREHRVVPIHDGQCAVRPQQHIARMEVAVAQDERVRAALRAIPQHAAQLLCPSKPLVHAPFHPTRDVSLPFLMALSLGGGACAEGFMPML